MRSTNCHDDAYNENRTWKLNEKTNSPGVSAYKCCCAVIVIVVKFKFKREY